MLYTRQKELLYIIFRLGKAGKTQLQKLEFLSCIKSGKPTFYFFPYKYGPYSLILQKDLDYLTSTGYIAYHDEHYLCSSPIQVFTDKARKSVLDETISWFRDYTAKKLMTHIYRTYPYYAINSEKACELLNDEELMNVDKENPDAETPHMFTIGYEGRSIDKYLDLLISNGVNLLIDVRANGISMKPEFSSKRLAAYCALVNIEYRHIPQVGISSEKRKIFSAKDALFSEYLQDLQTSKSNDLTSLFHETKKAKRLALTCFEMDYHECHRNVLAKELISRFNMEIRLTHL